MSGGGKVIGRRRARGITQAAQARSGIRARKLGDTLDEAQRVALTAPGATPLRVFLCSGLGTKEGGVWARRRVFLVLQRSSEASTARNILPPVASDSSPIAAIVVTDRPTLTAAAALKEKHSGASTFAGD